MHSLRLTNNIDLSINSALYTCKDKCYLQMQQDDIIYFCQMSFITDLIVIKAWGILITQEKIHI